MSHDEGITDPKKQFLIKLVNMIDSAGWLLASSEYQQALSVLAVLLGRIEITGDRNRELKELQQKMIHEYETVRLTPAEVRLAFHMVSEYMNETYFKELTWITPRIKGEGHLK